MSPPFGFIRDGVDLVDSSSLRKRSMHLTKSLTHSVGEYQHAHGDVGGVARPDFPPTANEWVTEHRCMVSAHSLTLRCHCGNPNRTMPNAMVISLEGYIRLTTRRWSIFLLDELNLAYWGPDL